MLKIATAFSGGLAALEFALRYEDLKHEVVFACEWDKYARKQYLEFHGEPKTFYNDISDLIATKYKDQIDLFVWGSPCQDLSLAGKRKGFDGEKSSLFREGARVMSEMMPKAFIFENVKGLLSSNGGSDYKEVIKTFQDMGYLIASKVVNAKEHGTAQNRERVFVVGFLDEGNYHAFNFAEIEPLVKCLRDYLEDEVDEKYYLSQKMIDGMVNKDSKFQGKFTPKDKDVDSANCIVAKEGNNVTSNFVSDKMKIQAFHDKDDSHCACIRAGYYKMGMTDPYIKEPKILVKSATKSGYEVATENDSINFTHPNSETRRGRVGKGVAQTLDCACNQGVIEPQIGAIRGRNPDNPNSRVSGLPTQQMLEICENGTANYLTTVQKDNVVIETKVAFNIKESVRKNFVRDYNDILKSDKPVFYSECDSGFQDNKVCLKESACIRAGNNDLFALDNEFRIRRLTPKECFRLQGIKNEDIKLINSDTQSYKIAGNAIEVNTMRSIIRQLYKPTKKEGVLF